MLLTALRVSEAPKPLLLLPATIYLTFSTTPLGDVSVALLSFNYVDTLAVAIVNSLFALIRRSASSIQLPVAIFDAVSLGSLLRCFSTDDGVLFIRFSHESSACMLNF